MIIVDNDKERVILATFFIGLENTLKKSKKYSELFENLLEYFYKESILEKDIELEVLLADIKKKNLANRLAKIIIDSSDSIIDTKKIVEKNENKNLKTIFSTISLNPKNGVRVKNNRYKLGELKHENIFPVNTLQFTDKEMEKLIADFLSEIKAIKAQDFKVLYSNLLDIAKKYLWSVPLNLEDTIVSLYDYLKTTIAVATALLDSQKNYDEDFILIAGDISGIQKYIYGLESTDGVAKRLRARSFFIKLISDVTSYKIVDLLDLSIANIIISSGGKFYILSPNNDEVIEKISNLEKEINKYLFENYYGDLFLNLQYLKLKKDDIGNNFSDKYDKLNDKLDLGKHKKFSREVFENQVFEEKLYSSGEKVTQCKICGKRLTKNKDGICSCCNRDEELGRKLTKMDKLAFYKVDDLNNIPYDIEIFGIACKIIKERENILGNPLFVHYYRYSTKGESNYPCIRDFYGGYAPLDSNEDVMTFENLAEQSSSNNLGILKGDVDNLGLIFSLGLKNQGDTSIAKISSLSRMMDTFFSYWLVRELKKKNYHYVVYAGGDDFMIVAPWDRVVDTAKFINDKFKEFTGINEDITLTCGISITKPKDPIYFSAQWATEAEEKGKDSGKNGFVLFDRYIPWIKYKEVFDLADFIDKNMSKKVGNNSLSYSQAFLYRLLHYTEMAEEYQKTKNSKYLKYLSDFSYDIGRNLVSKIKDKGKVPLEDERIAKLNDYFGIESVFGDKNKQEFLSNYMRVVLNYVVRKNRGDNDGF